MNKGHGVETPGRCASGVREPVVAPSLCNCGDCHAREVVELAGVMHEELENLASETVLIARILRSIIDIVTGHKATVLFTFHLALSAHNVNFVTVYRPTWHHV